MEPPAVSAQMLDREQGGTWSIKPVAPFHDDSTLVEELLQAEIDEVGARGKPVQVDVG
jgi:hypothetical protein